jgi:alcohol dehydrogenase (cytochrome c)
MSRLLLISLAAVCCMSADEVADGKAGFSRLCSQCHGADAAGGERGPSLRSWVSRSPERLKQVIRVGVPTRGMPAFNLPDAQLDPIVAFLRSLPEEPSKKEKRIVRIQLRGGRSVECSVGAESTFDLQCVDANGILHSLKRDAIASIDTMPALGPSSKGPSGFERIASPQPGEWPSYNGQLSGNRHSALRQINTSNVGSLRTAWTFASRDSQRLEVTPVAMDGFLYVTSVNQVNALDATTGRQIWRYRRDRTKGLAGDAAGGINRGVAILGDRIFLVTDHAHLIALDRRNGTLLWDIEMADHKQNYGATGAPLVVNDLVISGVSGGDEGARGFVAAYRADTGKRVWQFWTVPAPGDPEAATWKGAAIEHGCSTTWLTSTYDPHARLLYWVTGNPCPDYNGDERIGDNLYSDSVLALDPDTGKMRWYFQFTPHDLHDWDAVQTPVLVDANWKGRPRKLLLQANRNGFFYVLDRLTGEFLSGKPFALQTWATGLDAKGRPQAKPEATPTPEGVKVCPAVEGATNWFSPAYSAATGLFYVMSLDKCTIYTKSDPVWKAGESYYGGDTKNVPGEPGQKFLRALSLETGKLAWEVPQTGPANSWGGVLSTDGGLVFYCEDSGAFAAVDAKTGKPLWHFNTNQQWKASPMTYSVGGKQFVAVAAAGQIFSFALPD